MSDCPVQVDDFATLFAQAMVAAVVLGDTDPPNHIEKLRGFRVVESHLCMGVDRKEQSEHCFFMSFL